MAGRLEVRRWLRLGAPLHAVALSSDGQVVAVGAETGLFLFDAAGEAILGHPAPEMASPVRQIALAPVADRIYLGTRTGDVVRASLRRHGDQLVVDNVATLYSARNDLHALAVSPDERWIALGHLSARLTVLTNDGQLHWRSQPGDVASSMWSAVFDRTGKKLYAASAGAGTNRLVAIDLAQGQFPADGYLEPSLRATALATYDDGVVAVLLDSTDYECEIVKCSADLTVTQWTHSPREMVTAIATEPALASGRAESTKSLAAACGYEGRVILLDGNAGHVLAETALRVGVNALALAQGRIVAAVTQDDTLALLHYVP